jgi:hypothetical protein
MAPVRPADEAVEAPSRARATARPPARSRFTESPETEPTPAADTQVVEPVGPMPRASRLATLSLLVGVVAAIAVATGSLARIGAGLGVIAALLAFGGIAASGRRHVTGKGDATLGLLLGLASLVFAVMAMTGQFSWFTTHTDLVGELHRWLQVHASWLLAS